MDNKLFLKSLASKQGILKEAKVSDWNDRYWDLMKTALGKGTKLDQETLQADKYLYHLRAEIDKLLNQMDDVQADLEGSRDYDALSSNDKKVMAQMAKEIKTLKKQLEDFSSRKAPVNVGVYK